MRQKKTTSNPAESARTISERVERGADILESKTPNAQHPTPNVEFRRSGHYLAFLSAVRMLAAKILISSSTSVRQAGRSGICPNFFKRVAKRSQHSFRAILSGR